MMLNIFWYSPFAWSNGLHILPVYIKPVQTAQDRRTVQGTFHMNLHFRHLRGKNSQVAHHDNNNDERKRKGKKKEEEKKKISACVMMASYCRQREVCWSRLLAVTGAVRSLPPPMRVTYSIYMSDSEWLMTPHFHTHRLNFLN